MCTVGELGHEQNWVQTIAVLKNDEFAIINYGEEIDILNEKLIKKNSLNETASALIVLHDGNLVSGSANGSIKIWRKHKIYEIIRNFHGHSGAVHCFTIFSNTDFASASADKTIRIWSSSGDHKRTLYGHTGSIWSLAALSNGDLASGSCDGTIKVWNRNGHLKKTLSDHSDCVKTLLVLNDGFLASGSSDHSIKIWNRTGHVIQTHRYHKGQVLALAQLPNGDLLSASNDGSIKIKSKNELLLQGDGIKDTLNLNYDVRTLIVLSNEEFISGSRLENIIWSSQNSK